MLPESRHIVAEKGNKSGHFWQQSLMLFYHIKPDTEV